MARYFAGNGLAAFTRSSLQITERTATALYCDTTLVNRSINFSTAGRAEFIESCPFTATATGTVWFHWEQYQAGATGVADPAFYVFNGTTNVFKLQQTVNSYQASYWNGSAWVATGTGFTIPSALARVDIRIDLNSGFEAFVNGLSLMTGTGWTGGQTAITKFQITAANSPDVSQVMVADYDLRDSRLACPTLNGNSATNTGAASGVYTDVNELGVDDGTAINITASGNKAGQTKASITLPMGYVIAAVGVSARGRAAGSITDGKLGIRSGGTNYSSTGRSYPTAYSPRQHIVTNDPATGSLFTAAGFNSAEIYLEAA